MKILSTPMHYKLNRLPYSMNKTNLIFVQNKFIFYAGFFSLINGPCVYSGKFSL